jgi:hypothetical protein
MEYFEDSAKGCALRLEKMYFVEKLCLVPVKQDLHCRGPAPGRTYGDVFKDLYLTLTGFSYILWVNRYVAQIRTSFFVDLRTF